MKREAADCDKCGIKDIPKVVFISIDEGTTYNGVDNDHNTFDRDLCVNCALNTLHFVLRGLTKEQDDKLKTYLLDKK